MNTKRAAAVAAIVAGSLVLTACGSSANPLDSASSGSAEAGSAGSASAPSGDGSGSSAPSGSASGSGLQGSSGSSGSSGSAPSAASGSSDASSGASGTSGSDASSSATSGSATSGSATSGSATSGSDAAGGPIVIGSANFLEAELLAEVYAAALTAQGVEVSTHLNIGSREIYLKAMQDGSINLLPEYTGGLLAYYDKDSTATSPDDVYSALVQALPDSLMVLDKSSATDQDTITVTKQTAEQYDLTTIGDLAPVAGDMTLGGSSEFQTRPYGPQGLKDVYGVVFKNFKVLADSGGPLTVKALKTGLVDATDIFTTNPAIKKNGFVVLKDTKNLFQAQNVVPLIAKSVATPTVKDTLNAVSDKLTTAALTELQRIVQDTKADPADVAAKWVSDNGLS